MKIIQVTQRFYPALGGVENHVYNIAKRLVEKGHKVAVYTSDLLKDDPPVRLLSRAEREIDGIEIRRFKAFKLIPNIDASVVFPSMVMALLKCKADVIHAHNYCYFPAYSAALAHQITGIPLVLTTHISAESGLPTLRKLYNNTVGKFILQTVDRIVTLTKRDAEYLTSIGARAEKILIVPNGVDMNLFCRHTNGPRFKEKYGVDESVILFVGRLCKQKGLEYLLESMPKILKEVPDAVLVIVGPDFGVKAKLRARISQLGIDNMVVFTGLLPYNELLDSYAASDVFVLPSIVEPFGIVLLEAMAMGKPIVATNVSAAYDLIQDGVNGFLIKPGDSHSIAGPVINLLQNKKLAKKMGDINRSIVAQYSWDNIVQEIEQVYHKVVEEG